MKWLAVALLFVAVLLQYRIWLSDDGIREVQRLTAASSTQRLANDQLVERNRQLAAEVHDLKSGMTALEERARSDLGMIATHETFYQVVSPQPTTASGANATGAAGGAGTDAKGVAGASAATSNSSPSRTATR